MDQVILDLESDVNPAKVDMGTHEQAYAAMVSFRTANGKLAIDPTYGKIAGDNSRYRRCECTRIF